jgi:hypothetical protein
MCGDRLRSGSSGKDLGCATNKREVERMKIEIQVGGAVGRATLLKEAAPRTVEALIRQLPIVDRTIQTRWSGDAWRTEGNYELLNSTAAIENVADRLKAGDLIYYPGYASGLLKIGMAYGSAKWLAPFMVPIDVSLIGHVDENLDALVAVCSRIIFDGPLPVRITAVSAG